MMKPMSQFFRVRQYAQLLGSDSFPSEIISAIPWLDRWKDSSIVVVSIVTFKTVRNEKCVFLRWIIGMLQKSWNVN